MFVLDYEFNNNDNHIFIPPISLINHFKKIESLNIHYFNIKGDNGYYYSINTINNLIKHFRTLQECLYDTINSNKVAKGDKWYSKNLHNIFQLNINILKKKSELITNNNIKEVKNILTYKFEFEIVIKIDFINFKNCYLFKLCSLNYTNYTNYDYITYKDKIKEIEKEIEKKQEFKKYKEKCDIEEENQMMYMNDPYIIKLKLNVIDYYPENTRNKIFGYNGYNYSYSDYYDRHTLYVNAIGKDYGMSYFDNDLKSAYKIFNNRRKTKEHFRDKGTEYNYQEIKNRNKQLNQEFKRVYKLISKNIGFNLVSQ